MTATITTTQYSTLPSGFLTPYATYTTTNYYTETDYQETYIPEGAYTTTVTNEPTFAYANQFAEAYFGNIDPLLRDVNYEAYFAKNPPEN